MTNDATDGFVHVRGANEHNLRNVDVDIPRNAMVAFTGISGSGKSSLAFGTLYAEAQRRYFESVAPYARRLLQQVGAPHVQEVTGLPPAVALQQRRGAATSRSSVGTLTTLSNLPEGLSSAAGMKRNGRSARYVFGVWSGVALASGIAGLLGCLLLQGASAQAIAAITALAAGAILTMVADTMIPEAFEKTHLYAGVIAALGFLTAFTIGRSG